MDKLWAPWRITYIKNLKQKGCIFCLVKKPFKSALKQKKYDKKNLVILRSKSCFSLMNLFPYNNGHLMVAPFRHISKLADLDNEEILDLIKTTAFMIKILDGTIKPQGYNIGINIGKDAGAGIVGHLHIHIVPRWQGDTNFMPIISGAKVIAQSLQELYKILQNEIARSHK